MKKHWKYKPIHLREKRNVAELKANIRAKRRELGGVVKNIHPEVKIIVVPEDEYELSEKILVLLK